MSGARSHERYAHGAHPGFGALGVAALGKALAHLAS
jgi:hypothetical protein